MNLKFITGKDGLSQELKFLENRREILQRKIKREKDSIKSTLKPIELKVIYDRVREQKNELRKTTMRINAIKNK